MRLLPDSLVVLILLTCTDVYSHGQDKASARFGIDANLDRFPQKTPRETLASVLRAIDEKRVDYLLAHLADPDFVKAKLNVLKAQLPASVKPESRDAVAFQQLVKATAEHFKDEPTRVKYLARIAKSGSWLPAKTGFVATLATIPGHKVYMKKIDARWFLEDRDR